MVLFRGQVTLRWWHDLIAHYVFLIFPFCRNIITYHFQFSGTYYLEESKITSFLSSEGISNADMLYNSLWKRERGVWGGKTDQTCLRRNVVHGRGKSLSRKNRTWAFRVAGEGVLYGMALSPFQPFHSKLLCHPQKARSNGVLLQEKPFP